MAFAQSKDASHSRGDLRLRRGSQYNNVPLRSQDKTMDKEPLLADVKHSIGCPKYKAMRGARRDMNSPTRFSGTLHPRPWGARDPKEILCTCTTPVKPPLKSAPPSIRTSPARETRPTTRDTLSPKDGGTPAEEILEMFDEICHLAAKESIRLDPQLLNTTFAKLRNTLGSDQESGPSQSSGPSSSKSNQPLRCESSSREIHSKSPRSLQRLQNRARAHQRLSLPSNRTIHRKIEANNVVLEVSGSDFPNQAAFANMFGCMSPTDGFQYAALSGNQFFGPGEVLNAALPAAAIMTIDSATAFLPMSDVTSTSPRISRNVMCLPPKRRN